jgi:nitroreductase
MESKIRKKHYFEKETDCMRLKELIRKNRSYRRFDQEYTVSTESLRDLVDLARLSASGANKQPLKYVLCSQPDTNKKVFATLGWAAYLKDWAGPIEGERPSAYIIILGDLNIRSSFGVDPGIAAQSVTLGAVEQGLGACIIATINKKELHEALNISKQFEILFVLALGKPIEKVVIEPLGSDGDIRYWRDEDGAHHLPKRSLEDLIVAEY